jgi:ArsR family transcriptional regulator
MAESTAIELTRAGADADVALLQAVADPVRWAVLDALGSCQRCVCDLQERVPVAGNLLSYHLKVLREVGLVTATRRGRWIDYALADAALDRMRGALPGVRAGACA